MRRERKMIFNACCRSQTMHVALCVCAYSSGFSFRKTNLADPINRKGEIRVFLVVAAWSTWHGCLPYINFILLVLLLAIWGSPRRLCAFVCVCYAGLKRLCFLDSFELSESLSSSGPGESLRVVLFVSYISYTCIGRRHNGLHSSLLMRTRVFFLYTFIICYNK